MNLSCGSRTIKYLIFTFNFFFVITGIILVAVGASIHAYYTQYNFFLNNEYFSLPNMLIATGSLIFIICFLGCYGAIKNSWIMLMAFSVLLGIIFVFEFSAGIAGYVLRDKTTRYLEDSMNKAKEQYNKDASSAVMWDLVQRTYECCGVNNYTDWNKVFNSPDLPVSCCREKAGTSGSFYCNAVGPTSAPPAPPAANDTTVAPTSNGTDPSLQTATNATDTHPTNDKLASNRRRRDINLALKSNETTTPPYNVGCEAAFGKWVKAHAVDIGAVCFTLAVLQLIGIGFSCHLSKQLKNSYYST